MKNLENDRSSQVNDMNIAEQKLNNINKILSENNIEDKNYLTNMLYLIELFSI